MLKEKNPLLNLKLNHNKRFLSDLYDSFSEGIFMLYDFILEEPVENFWYECFNIIISYFQLIAFIFDKTVSLI